MTKAAALYDFFSSFGITAYASTNVPDDVIFPYLTYTPVLGSFGDTSAAITVNLWYYTDSEAIPNAKAEEISKRLGLGGERLACDDGVIWLTRGAPWCQSLTDETSKSIKRRYININAEFITI